MVLQAFTKEGLICSQTVWGSSLHHSHRPGGLGVEHVEYSVITRALTPNLV